MSRDIQLLQEVSRGDTAAAELFTSSFGYKTYGLTRIPKAWRLPGLTIGQNFWSVYLRTGRQGAEDYLRQHQDLLRATLTSWFPILVRSSGTTETVQDRGKYLSVPVSQFDEILNACIHIFDQFAEHKAVGGMALLLQPAKQARVRGYASNFRRVSKTRNQWQAEVEYSSSGGAFVLGEGLRYNSQRNEPYAAGIALPSCPTEDQLINALKGIGAWLNANLNDVVSVEWIDDNEHLWIVQCDDEIDPPLAIDPASLSFPTIVVSSGSSEVEPFEQYEVGSDTPVRKLRILDDFQTATFQASHHIFHATAEALRGPLSTDHDRRALAQRISSFGPNGVVIRTDITAEGAEALPNLPRTDTVHGPAAVTWLTTQLEQLTHRGTPPAQIHFLMHRFIRAKASAWSYHEPGQRVVYIDGSWGLPDGLQFYPHDTYEFSLVEQRLIRSIPRFKPYVLWPSGDGQWKALNVQSKKARAQALDLSTLRWIANYTAEISKKIGAAAQIMWFCDFEQPNEYLNPLPWFRETNPSKPTVLAAAPPAPSMPIRTIADLQKIGQRRSSGGRLILDPHVDLIRDRAFVETLISVCKGANYSIMFSGSVLAHAFSQLMAAGIVVYGTGGPRRRRTIGKQEFGKLVRDNIPSNISQRGEQVRYGVVDSKFKRALLLGKLIEELSELARAKEETRIEELADVYEVVRGIVSDVGVSWDDLVKTADEKAAKRGGFEKGIVLLQTNMSEDDPDLDADAISAPSAPLIRESTSTAVNASLNIRYTSFDVAIPFFELLAGKKISHDFIVGRQRVGIEIALDGDRIVVTLKDAGPAGSTETDVL